MRVKALRNKNTKEFTHFVDFNKKIMVCTSEIPNIQPMTATIELMKKIYSKEKFFDNFDDLDNFELVEFELIEVGEVGADIRNKLSPCKNLTELVKVFLDEEHPDKKNGLKKLIYEEIKQSKKSIKYLAGLL